VPLIQKQQLSLLPSWQKDIARDSKRCEIQGSYRKALAQELFKIIERALCSVIKEADRNFNISVFAQVPPVLQDLWLDIFSNHLGVTTIITDFSVENDGRVAPFVAKFPFSSLLYHSVEQKRLQVEQLL
jgi:hypothetical protein